MKWFRSQRKQTSAKLQYPVSITVTTATEISDADLDVVGESHYQDALWNIVGSSDCDADGKYRIKVQADLVAEPANEYDRNAVQVVIKGRIVGYLRRQDAIIVQPKLPIPHGLIWGHVIGGSPGKRSLGVFLHCPASLLE